MGVEFVSCALVPAIAWNIVGMEARYEFEESTLVFKRVFCGWYLRRRWMAPEEIWTTAGKRK